MLRRSMTSLTSLLNRNTSFTPSTPLQVPKYLSLFSSTSLEQVGSVGGVKMSFSNHRPILLIIITGGVTLCALNDLAIIHGCSSKAMEVASLNPKIIEALGEPIVRGPLNDASLAVGYKRHSVSCTFPVYGPQGSAIFQLKAIRNGEDSWFSFPRHNDWDFLVMEALLHVPLNEEGRQTYRVSLTGNILPPTNAVDDCKPTATDTPLPLVTNSPLEG